MHGTARYGLALSGNLWQMSRDFSSNPKTR